MSSNEAMNESAAEEQQEQTADAPRARRAKSKTAKKVSKKKATTTKRAGRTSADGPRLRVRQVRSTVRRDERFRRTLIALGIRHHQAEVVVRDTPAIRGMLEQVRHLVRVRAEES